jgi:hypothetical protein
MRCGSILKISVGKIGASEQLSSGGSFPFRPLIKTSALAFLSKPDLRQHTPPGTPDDSDPDKQIGTRPALAMGDKRNSGVLSTLGRIMILDVLDIANFTKSFRDY